MKETRTFEHVRESVVGARRFATELLDGGLDPDVREGIRLMSPSSRPTAFVTPTAVSS
jgi:hypothetical protein